MRVSNIGGSQTRTDHRSNERVAKLQVDPEHCRFGNTEQCGYAGSRSDALRLAVACDEKDGQRSRALSDIRHRSNWKQEGSACLSHVRQQLGIHSEEAVMHSRYGDRRIEKTENTSSNETRRIIEPEEPVCQSVARSAKDRSNYSEGQEAGNEDRQQRSQQVIKIRWNYLTQTFLDYR
ncbi:hypothetical protein D3C76_199070 [compost metagenome]